MKNFLRVPPRTEEGGHVDAGSELAFIVTTPC